ncbi:hypothetical protein AVEN_47037-1 [Araneus ventricosus]|uniref:Uncharacterized protein n=1 Tax=Araneus ventricosus TaxID=182803 RepID=A0A4Y2EXZ9_ARAVE|nr:hypothetical protein AVEN_47037-1 [Araneus ventricosus]
MRVSNLYLRYITDPASRNRKLYKDFASNRNFDLDCSLQVNSRLRSNSSYRLHNLKEDMNALGALKSLDNSEHTSFLWKREQFLLSNLNQTTCRNGSTFKRVLLDAEMLITVVLRVCMKDNCMAEYVCNEIHEVLHVWMKENLLGTGSEFANIACYSRRDGQVE